MDQALCLRRMAADSDRPQSVTRREDLGILDMEDNDTLHQTHDTLHQTEKDAITPYIVQTFTNWTGPTVSSIQL